MKSEFAADLEGRSQGVFQAAPERCSGCVQPQRLEIAVKSSSAYLPEKMMSPVPVTVLPSLSS